MTHHTYITPLKVHPSTHTYTHPHTHKAHRRHQTRSTYITSLTVHTHEHRHTHTHTHTSTQDTYTPHHTISYDIPTRRKHDFWAYLHSYADQAVIFENHFCQTFCCECTTSVQILLRDLYQYTALLYLSEGEHQNTT